MDEILNIYATALDEYKAKNFDAALKILERLRILAPNWAKATLLKSYIFNGQKKFLSEIDALQKSFAQCNVEDRFFKAEILSRLGSAYHTIGETALSVENFLNSAELEENFSKKRIEISNAIFAANDSEKFSARDFKKLYDEYNKTFGDVKPFDKKIYRHKKLRIGYLSADFRTHPVANFIFAPIHFHDREKFSVYCYYSAKDFDDVTAQLKSAADFWRDVSDLNDEDAAKIIRDDEIDILIELGGHTNKNRLAVMAYRPANVQISGVGYMNSTGCKFVDYFLTDRFCAEDLSAWKNFFTEKPLILPHSHFCYTPLKNFPAIGDAPCISKGYVTFGCFNNFNKVNDFMLETWQKILQRVPKSKLILKHKIFDGDEGKNFVRQRLQRLNFDLNFVELRGFTANYLDEYRDIDIALDTYPYTGGLTTCDALFMGVPVISLYGERHGSRFGYSILNNVGIGELAVKNREDYINLAAALANDFETLSILHKNLRGMMTNSPLMNAKNYVRDFYSLLPTPYSLK